MNCCECGKEVNDIMRQRYSCQFCKKKFYCCLECMKIDYERGHFIECKKKFRELHSGLERQCPFIKGGRILTYAEVKRNEESTFGPDDGSLLRSFERVNKNNSKSALLGRGSNGEVWLVKHKKDGQLYALKIIKSRSHKNLEKSVVAQVEKELELHRQLEHENIIKLHTSIKYPNSIFILLEYAKKGTLFQYIKTKKVLSEREAFFFFVQVCTAVNFLHKNQIMHRDIKPENLLISDRGIVKLCDFGCCTKCDEGVDGRKSFCGTIEYMAPEIVKREFYGHSVDIWSLGVLLYEMLHGYSPFRGKSDKDRVDRIQEGKLVFAPHIKTDAKELIAFILNPFAHERPAVIDILNSAWIKRMQQEFKIADICQESRKTVIVQQKTSEIPSLSTESPNKRPTIRSTKHQKTIQSPEDISVDPNEESGKDIVQKLHTHTFKNCGVRKNGYQRTLPAFYVSHKRMASRCEVHASKENRLINRLEENNPEIKRSQRGKSLEKIRRASHIQAHQSRAQPSFWREVFGFSTNHNNL